MGTIIPYPAEITVVRRRQPWRTWVTLTVLAVVFLFAAVAWPHRADPVPRPAAAVTHHPAPAKAAAVTVKVGKAAYACTVVPKAKR